MGTWVITCNTTYYDVVGAFNAFESINWKQRVDIQVGDTVYIYVGKPIGAIKYETRAVQVDLANATIDDSEYITVSNHECYDRYMELQLVKEFDEDLLPYKVLKEHGLNTVRGPSRVSNELEEFILEQENRLKHAQEDRAAESKLDQELIDGIDDMLTDLPEQEIQYTPEPKRKPNAIINSGHKTYPRDRKTAINALSRAKHNCEVDGDHPSFIRRNTNTKYAEPHHLIPLAYQDSFENSLDVEANIVSLCSNCHNLIHYGAGSEKLIEFQYMKRKQELEQAGISISLSELLDLY